MGRCGRRRLHRNGGAALTPRAATAAVLLVAAALTGCGDDEGPQSAPPAVPSTTPVPPPFAAVCGRPGAEVTLPEPARPYVVPHALCDLTGVTVSYVGRGGAVVPPRGEGVSGVSDGPDAEGGLEIQTDARTGDVTIRPVD